MLLKFLVLLFLLLEYTTSEPSCPPNEIYNACGSACPSTCQKPKPSVCIALCVPGCYCKPTFIRDEKSGKCTSKCYPICGPNESFDSCGSACTPTCQKPTSTFCTFQCVPGCYCQQNLIRDERSGRCVRSCSRSRG
ncbi:chymotrypsin inhibitor Ani s 6-like [Harmonia axyridis]|uniref:chymotrypsin inhibitor Ani s 6-like n=1 Tax=Harmonia axyridis TaxID=115357 RepID=UPI001E27685F|nr:chymotrypsin inhibitor Ani s 6-like [Harmonia axyridis]